MKTPTAGWRNAKGCGATVGAFASTHTKKAGPACAGPAFLFGSTRRCLLQHRLLEHAVDLLVGVDAALLGSLGGGQRFVGGGAGGVSLGRGSVGRGLGAVGRRLGLGNLLVHVTLGRATGGQGGEQRNRCEFADHQFVLHNMPLFVGKVKNRKSAVGPKSL